MQALFYYFDIIYQLDMLVGMAKSGSAPTCWLELQRVGRHPVCTAPPPNHPLSCPIGCLKAHLGERKPLVQDAILASTNKRVPVGSCVIMAAACDPSAA